MRKVRAKVFAPNLTKCGLFDIGTALRRNLLVLVVCPVVNRYGGYADCFRQFRGSSALFGEVFFQVHTITLAKS